MEATMNKIIEVTVDADVFVIPNHAPIADASWSYGQRLINFWNRAVEISGLEYNPETDHMIQVWLTGEESVGSDNLARHGFTINADNLDYTFHNSCLENIPEKIFYGYKEGDVVTFTVLMKPDYAFDKSIEDSKERYKNSIRFDKSNEGPEFMITFNLKLNQKDYRYRSFGNFEDVVEKVIR